MCIHSSITFNPKKSKSLGSLSPCALIIVYKPPFGFEMRKIKSPKYEMLKRTIQPLMNTYTSMCNWSSCHNWMCQTSHTNNLHLLQNHVVSPKRQNKEKISLFHLGYYQLWWKTTIITFGNSLFTNSRTLLQYLDALFLTPSVYIWIWVWWQHLIH